MNIAFCINSKGLIGLGVTLSSLIQNCSDSSKLKFWFLCAKLSEKEKNLIIRLLKSEDFQGKNKLIDFDPKTTFGSFPSLHGDWTPYGRLLLANLVEANEVLYLDSDVVVELDVLEVDNFNFGGYPLAAVSGGRFRFALGSEFYLDKIGMPPDTAYFNSGVLLLNLNLWRSRNVMEECLRMVRQYSEELPSHDQSILNIFCAGKFAKLPPSFNCEWIAYMPKPTTSERMVLHFVGSPKPWDPMGFLVHNGYYTWIKYLNPEWSLIFHRYLYSFTCFSRLWKIRRSYIRCIINKINSIRSVF